MNNFQINQVKRILREYNPEYDVPDGPHIPWYTELLASALVEQHTEIEALKAQLEYEYQIKARKTLRGEK